MSRERKLTELEKAVWSEATKGVKPINHKHAIIEKPRQSIKINHIQEVRFRVLTEQLSIDPVKIVPSKLERTQKTIVEGRIDLHGYTLNQAEEELKRFLLRVQASGKRWVLVITGKGFHGDTNNLRHKVPKWLDQWGLVSGYRIAKLQDGGNGALYVHVRKNRQ